MAFVAFSSARSKFAFLVFSLALTSFKQPFANYYLNRLESLSLLSSTITVYCGLFYISDGSLKREFLCKKFKNYFIVKMTEDSKRFLFATIVISHIIFLIYWLLHFLQEMRTTIRARLPTIYLTLFLCCRKR
jgi:hypothetical protein